MNRFRRNGYISDSDAEDEEFSQNESNPIHHRLKNSLNSSEDDNGFRDTSRRASSPEYGEENTSAIGKSPNCLEESPNVSQVTNSDDGNYICDSENDELYSKSVGNDEGANRQAHTFPGRPSSFVNYNATTNAMNNSAYRRPKTVSPSVDDLLTDDESTDEGAKVKSLMQKTNSAMYNTSTLELEHEENHKLPESIAVIDGIGEPIVIESSDDETSSISSFESAELDKSVSMLEKTFDEVFQKPLARSTLVPTDFKAPETTRYLSVPLHVVEENQNPPQLDESCEIIDDTEIEDSMQSPPARDKDSRQGMNGIVPESGSSLGIESSNEHQKEGGSYSSAKTTLSSSNGSSAGTSHSDSQSELQILKKKVEEKNFALRNLSFAIKNCDPRKLKDGGKLLREKMEQCQIELAELQQKYEEMRKNNIEVEVIDVKTVVKKDIIFSIKDQKTAGLGEKALETHRVEKALTMDSLVSLHSGLATAPNAEVLADPPEGLSTTLMPHQLQALAWLLHREKQSPAGGILADDMGLGKTLTMISLVLKSKQLEGHTINKNSPWYSRLTGPAHPGGTLVVCPASLIAQWDEQVKTHVRRGHLETLMHHGGNREGRGRYLTGADIVITTYGVLSQENKTKGALFRVAWNRVILDEAHNIRNHKTQAAVAACELQAKYRWCLSGTPVHNKELDMYSLLKFLKCEPFDDLAIWKRWVDNKTAAGTERLNTVVKAILLRRTKEELKTAGGLKGALAAKEVHSIRVNLDELEFAAYQSVLAFSMTLVGQYLMQRAEKIGELTDAGRQRIKSQLKQGGEIKTHEILVLLLRLRQICCLPGLISAMLEPGDVEVDGLDKEDQEVEDLFKQVRRLTISAPPPEKHEIDSSNILVTSNPVFNIDRPSSKILKVIGIVASVVEKGDKIVVVSQWSTYLRHLAHHLKVLNVKMATLDGSVLVKHRGPIVEEFNDPSSRLKILLLSLTAGGVGLNLMGGNHLIITEPHWNPQLESQACDRVYRVGQTKDVQIYKIVCSETIEERIEALQLKKLQLAETVVSGQLKKDGGKLTLQDIKSLFGLSPTN